MSLLKIAFTTFGVLLVTLATAQPPTPPATPIDGGLGLLLAGGAIYGLRKLRDISKK